MDDGSVILRCSACNTKNRIPRNRLSDRPVCGKCRTPLQVSTSADRTIDITDGTFKTEILASPTPVIVDCWAPWCGPCRMVAPILDQLASEYAGRTMLFFKNGALVDRVVGALPKAAIEQHLLSLIDET